MGQDWHPHQDSNLGQVYQKHLCYHYTMGTMGLIYAHRGALRAENRPQSQFPPPGMGDLRPPGVPQPLRVFSSSLQGILTNMVLLAFGGNMGDVQHAFRKALSLLAEAGFHATRVSSPYRNPAVGCEEGAPDFTNWVVLGTWEGTPEELLDAVQEVEVTLGRPRIHPHWHSRTMDIDIIECNGALRQTGRLVLPHPRWRERDFVLIPMSEILSEDERRGIGLL